jgi:hypothetical protein
MQNFIEINGLYQLLITRHASERVTGEKNMAAAVAKRATRRGRSAYESRLSGVASKAIAGKPERKNFRAIGAEKQPVPGRRYVSPTQLQQLFPYSKHSWRLWVYQGRIPGCLKPNGKRGRLLIPLDEAEKLMQAGAQG